MDQLQEVWLIVDDDDDIRFMMSEILRKEGYDVLLADRVLFTAAAIEMVAGALALIALSTFTGEDVSRFAGASRDAWLGLAYLTVFGSLVGFTAFAYCINELPATTVGTYAYVNPVVAVFLGAAFLDERITSGLLAGGALILVAVLFTTMGRRATPPPVAEAEG